VDPRDELNSQVGISVAETIVVGLGEPGNKMNKYLLRMNGGAHMTAKYSTWLPCDHSLFRSEC
jgi:hypothetical protein